MLDKSYSIKNLLYYALPAFFCRPKIPKIAFLWQSIYFIYNLLCFCFILKNRY